LQVACPLVFFGFPFCLSRVMVLAIDFGGIAIAFGVVEKNLMSRI
jgi:hypothetical protein